MSRQQGRLLLNDSSAILIKRIYLWSLTSLGLVRDRDLFGFGWVSQNEARRKGCGV